MQQPHIFFDGLHLRRLDSETVGVAVASSCLLFLLTTTGLRFSFLFFWTPETHGFTLGGLTCLLAGGRSPPLHKPGEFGGRQPPPPRHNNYHFSCSGAYQQAYLQLVLSGVLLDAFVSLSLNIDSIVYWLGSMHEREIQDCCLLL